MTTDAGSPGDRKPRPVGDETPHRADRVDGMTRKGLAAAGVTTITVGIAVLTIPLATIESWNPVSVVGGGIILAGLVVLVTAGFRARSAGSPQPTPADVRREQIRSALRPLRDDLIDADRALDDNETARKRSATFSDGGGHLYDTRQNKLSADRKKIVARIEDLEQELADLDRAESA